MSMKLHVTIKNTKELNKKLRAIKENMDDKVMKSLVIQGERIRGYALRSLKTRTQGKRVTRYGGAKGKRTVVVSPPLSAPNPDTKRALKSVAIEVDEGKMQVAVGTNLVYLAALEFNSRVNRRKARPWLRPAWQEWRKRFKGFKSDLRGNR
jgi:hypothetical protein